MMMKKVLVIFILFVELDVDDYTFFYYMMF